MYQTIICVASIFFIDQLTKYLALACFLDHPQTIELTSFLNIILVWNKGIGFGLLPAGNLTHVILLILLGLTLSALLIYFMIKAQTKWQLLSFSMILGGGISNIIDRIRFGAVVDFLDFHLFSYHWATFNVADSAITIGVVFLLIECLLKMEKVC